MSYSPNRLEVFIVAFVVGFIFGMGLMGAKLSHDWRADAIKNGVGEYNPQTGKFQWKQSE